MSSADVKAISSHGRNWAHCSHRLSFPPWSSPRCESWLELPPSAAATREAQTAISAILTCICDFCLLVAVCFGCALWMGRGRDRTAIPSSWLSSYAPKHCRVGCSNPPSCLHWDGTSNSCRKPMLQLGRWDDLALRVLLAPWTPGCSCWVHVRLCPHPTPLLLVPPLWAQMLPLTPRLQEPQPSQENMVSLWWCKLYPVPQLAQPCTDQSVQRFKY